MELLYFSDSSQLDYVIAEKPELLKSMCPITSDMSVASELDRLGIDFIDEWKYLTSEDINENWEVAHRLAKGWCNDKKINSRNDGLDFTEVVEQELIYPFEGCLNARTVYNNVFDNYQVTKISGFFLPPTAVIRTGPDPTSRAVSSVVQAVLFYIAEQRGISVEYYDSPYPMSITRTSQKHRRIIGEVKNDCTYTGDDNKKIVLIYESLMPKSEYNSILEILNKLADIKIVSISPLVLENGITFNQKISDRSDEAIKFSVSVIKNDFYNGYAEIFSNEYLQFQFNSIVEEMVYAKNCGKVFELFLEILNPSLIIFGHEAFTVERYLVNMANKRGIQTIALVHGGLGFKIGSRGLIGDADKILVWSKKDVDWLTYYGANKSKIHKIGCLRYEKKYKDYLNRSSISFSKKKDIAKEYLGLDQKKPLVVLITAAIHTGYAAIASDPNKHRDVMKNYLQYAQSRQDLQFIIKAHPSFDHYDFYRRILNNGYSNIKLVEKYSLDEILEASDVAVMINYVTSAAIEAMLHSIPIVYLNNAVYPIGERTDDGLYDTGIIRVSNIDELKVQIDNLINNPLIKASTLVEADKQLKMVLGINKISASDRVHDLIEQILEQQKNDQGRSYSGMSICQLLNANNTQSDRICTDFVRKHTAEYVMFACAYIAGYYNLGTSSVEEIYKLFHKNKSNVKSIINNELWWMIMEVYVDAHYTKYSHRKYIFINIRALFPYLLNPKRLFRTSTTFKRKVLKYFIIQLLAMYR